MKRSFLFLIVFVLLASCEYQADDDYYLEVSPPATETPFEINLNQIDPSDTIHVFSITDLSLRLNTGDKKLINLIINLDDHTLEYHRSYEDPNVYTFSINPWEVENGKHKLSINVTTSSNTNSLADMMGMEGYQGKMIWNLSICNDFDDRFKIDWRQTEDSLLELYWDIPRIPASVFDRYEIQVGYTHWTITNPDQKSVIVEDYVCGDVQCNINIYLKNQGWSLSHKYLNISVPIPKLYFENIGYNKLLIKWDKPFLKARFNLNYGYILTTDTFVYVPQPPFDSSERYHLQIYPEKSDDTYTNIYTSALHTIGYKIPFAYNYACYQALNTILAISYDKLWTIDPVTFNLSDKVMFSHHTSSLLSTIPGSSKTAIGYNSEYWIYPDETFCNPVILPRDCTPSLFVLTSNDRLFTIDGCMGLQECEVYDVTNGTRLFSIELNSIINTQWTVSADGRYLCEASMNGMTIYQLGAAGIERTISIPGYYTDAIFSQANPKQLIVKERDNIQLFVAPDFSKPAKSFVVASAYLINVDPVTGNLLYQQKYPKQDTLRVAHVESADSPLFSTSSVYSRDVILLYNHLINKSQSYIFDITPYLKP